MPYTALDFALADGIATLTLNRPQAKNALNGFGGNTLDRKPESIKTGG